LTRSEVKLIAKFGEARLVKKRGGKVELIGGSGKIERRCLLPAWPWTGSGAGSRHDHWIKTYSLWTATRQKSKVFL